MQEHKPSYQAGLVILLFLGIFAGIYWLSKAPERQAIAYTVSVSDSRIDALPTLARELVITRDFDKFMTAYYFLLRASKSEAETKRFMAFCSGLNDLRRMKEQEDSDAYWHDLKSSLWTWQSRQSGVILMSEDVEMTMPTEWDNAYPAHLLDAAIHINSAKEILYGRHRRTEGRISERTKRRILEQLIQIAHVELERIKEEAQNDACWKMQQHFVIEIRRSLETGTGPVVKPDQ